METMRQAAELGRDIPPFTYAPFRRSSRWRRCVRRRSWAMTFPLYLCTPQEIFPVETMRQAAELGRDIPPFTSAPLRRSSRWRRCVRRRSWAVTSPPLPLHPSGDLPGGDDASGGGVGPVTFPPLPLHPSGDLPSGDDASGGGFGL